MVDFNMPRAMIEVANELSEAVQKFPAFHSAHEGYAVIAEELDELWMEVKKQHGPERDAAMRREAIQVAAMALRFIEDLSL